MTVGREDAGTSPTLDDAILLAAQSHHGQKDEAGFPYILHVLEVMFRSVSDEEMITACLHDILEDTSVTVDALKQLGYPPKIIEAVELLTWKKEQETYEEYIKKVKSNKLAATIKRTDLASHLTPCLTGGPNWLERHYPELAKRYRWAQTELNRWKVLERDAFDPDAEAYTKGEYATETQAVHAAYQYLEHLEKTQPTSQSRGQSREGLQDRVYVESPNGAVRRILPRQARNSPYIR